MRMAIGIQPDEISFEMGHGPKQVRSEEARSLRFHSWVVHGETSNSQEGSPLEIHFISTAFTLDPKKVVITPARCPRMKLLSDFPVLIPVHSNPSSSLSLARLLSGSRLDNSSRPQPVAE